MNRKIFAILFIELIFIIIIQAQTYSDPITPIKEYYKKILPIFTHKNDKGNSSVDIYNVINLYYNINDGCYTKNNTLKMCIMHKDNILLMNASIIYNNEIRWYNILQVYKDSNDSFIVHQGKNIIKIKSKTYVSLDPTIYYYFYVTDHGYGYAIHNECDYSWYSSSTVQSNTFYITWDGPEYAAISILGFCWPAYYLPSGSEVKVWDSLGFVYYVEPSANSIMHSSGSATFDYNNQYVGVNVKVAWTYCPMFAVC